MQLKERPGIRVRKVIAVNHALIFIKRRNQTASGLRRKDFENRTNELMTMRKTKGDQWVGEPSAEGKTAIARAPAKKIAKFNERTIGDRDFFA